MSATNRTVGEKLEILANYGWKTSVRATGGPEGQPGYFTVTFINSGKHDVVEYVSENVTKPITNVYRRVVAGKL